MVTKLVTLSPETSALEAVARMLKSNITGAPVVSSESDYIGVFSDRCCIRVLTDKMQSEGTARRTELPRAKDMMTTRLVTLKPEMDVFDAIALLLKARISGAPVIDEKQRFLGVFSEKTSMAVLVTAVYDQLPSCRVETFIDASLNRVIEEDKDFWPVARMFLDTPYRRLPVVRDGTLVGQVSRRDVLNAASALYAPARRAFSGWLGGTNAELPGDSERVTAYTDTSARTIDEETDLLAIVQIFRETNFRRLPVLDGTKLAGQVSRRDILNVINGMISSSQSREKTLLYLSSLLDRQDAPIQ
jgi:CBS domain-containing protein